MERDRDYNNELNDTEDHEYAYDFDFQVMHKYMLRTFSPFLINGNALELGCLKGDFTSRLLTKFVSVDAVEASSDAAKFTKDRLGDQVTVFNSLFETVILEKKYNNVFLTHVLEHLDDPVAVLKRINDEWLDNDGRLFVVCPNANAPSRQIAVRMGLLSHNTVVSPAEKEHGHRITYTFDTLEREVKAAGLNILSRNGIFFKALANFQWDRLISTDIISEDYIEACFDIGTLYPDLCASICLVCEKGQPS